MGYPAGEGYRPSAERRESLDLMAELPERAIVESAEPGVVQVWLANANLHGAERVSVAGEGEPDSGSRARTAAAEGAPPVRSKAPLGRLESRFAAWNGIRGTAGMARHYLCPMKGLASAVRPPHPRID